MNTELDINILPTNPKANYKDGVIAGNVTAVSFFYKKKGDGDRKMRMAGDVHGKIPIIQVLCAEH